MQTFKSRAWHKWGFSNQELESLSVVINITGKRDNKCKIQFTNIKKHTNFV